MRLYIDSNIYLDYFRESGERLTSLRALKRLLQSGKLSLVVPEQTKQEYLRNKTSIVESARKNLVKESEIKFRITSTAIKDWKEIKDVNKKVEALKKAYKKVINKYTTQTEKEKTKAEVLIESVFDLGIFIKDSRKILDKAYYRYLKGNPPKKDDNSYGDAIIWETMLDIALNDALVIVTRDSDFVEEIRAKRALKTFLQKEWASKTNKKIKLYTSLGEFINNFEGKKTIGDKIIQGEKKEPLVNGSESYFKNLPSMSGTGTAFAVGSDGLLDPWYFRHQRNLASNLHSVIDFSGNEGVGLSSSYVIRKDKIQFCPYCGKNIEKEYDLEIAKNSRVYFYGPNTFKCPHCGNHIDMS